MSIAILKTAFVFVLVLSLSQASQEPRTENQVVRVLLHPIFQGELEASQWDGTRVDILTETHAIEVDWSRKWAEGIGQSLYYAELSRRSPGVVLLVGNLEEESRYIYRAQTLCAKHGIRLWVYDVPGRRLR